MKKAILIRGSIEDLRKGFASTVEALKASYPDYTFHPLINTIEGGEKIDPKEFGVLTFSIFPETERKKIHTILQKYCDFAIIVPVNVQLGSLVIDPAQFTVGFSFYNKFEVSIAGGEVRYNYDSKDFIVAVVNPNAPYDVDESRLGINTVLNYWVKRWLGNFRKPDQLKIKAAVTEEIKSGTYFKQ